MTTGTCWWHAEQNTADVVALLSQGWRGNSYLHLENLEAIQLKRATSAWLEALQADRAGLALLGRLFNAELEVRWERLPGRATQFQVWYLSEAAWTPPGSEWACTKFDEVEEGRALLWGERRAGDAHWHEARLPRPLDYPVAWTAEHPWAALDTRDYYQAGILRLTRLAGVVPVSAAEEAV